MAGQGRVGRVRDGHLPLSWSACVVAFSISGVNILGPHDTKRTEVVAFRLDPTTLTSLIQLARDWNVEDGMARTSLTIRNILERIVTMQHRIERIQ